MKCSIGIRIARGAKKRSFEKPKKYSTSWFFGSKKQVEIKRDCLLKPETIRGEVRRADVGPHTKWRRLSEGAEPAVG